MSATTYRYVYEGLQRDADGEASIVRNVIAAKDDIEAEALLEASGIEIWGVSQEGQIVAWLRSLPWPGFVVRLVGRFFPWMQAKVPNLALHLFFKNLASYIRTSKTIDALARMGKSNSNPTLKAVAQALAAHMQTMKFSAALALYPNVFGETVPKMVAGGEVSDLAAVCDRVSEWYLVQHEGGLDVLATFVSPGIMLLGGLGLGYGLRLGYVPTLQSLYDQYAHGAIPWYAQWTIHALDVLMNLHAIFGWLLMVGAALLVVRAFIMRTHWGRVAWEWTLVTFGGVFGAVFQASRTEDVAWTLSLAHASDLGWRVAFETAANQSRSARVHDALMNMSIRFHEESVTWAKCFQDDEILDPVLGDYLQGAEGATTPAESCAAAATLLHTHVTAHRRVVKDVMPNLASAAAAAPIAWMLFTLLAPMFLLVPQILSNAFTHSASGFPGAGP